MGEKGYGRGFKCVWDMKRVDGSRKSVCSRRTVTSDNGVDCSSI